MPSRSKSTHSWAVGSQAVGSRMTFPAVFEFLSAHSVARIAETERTEVGVHCRSVTYPSLCAVFLANQAISSIRPTLFLLFENLSPAVSEVMTLPCLRTAPADLPDQYPLEYSSALAASWSFAWTYDMEGTCPTLGASSGDITNPPAGRSFSGKYLVRAMASGTECGSVGSGKLLRGDGAGALTAALAFLVRAIPRSFCGANRRAVLP
mmetsp:Transcript_24054/g.59775  ORF Transcript_24054/g.59775 Transcript_24054/m.59775 type:complete len:208 (-) Transcript_24054:720-1343(-)